MDPDAQTGLGVRLADEQTILEIEIRIQAVANTCLNTYCGSSDCLTLRYLVSFRLLVNKRVVLYQLRWRLYPPGCRL